MIRRLLLGGGLWGGVLGTLAALPGIRPAHAQHASTAHPSASAQDKMAAHAGHGGMITVGEVDHLRNGFDPHSILTAWDTGTLKTDPDGRTVREFEIVAEDKEIEIAPGLFFPAWTYNGRVPGPTIRVTEGERVRVLFKNHG
jgi:manganese oxidase